MDPNELRSVKFYNTIVEITESILSDWNISLKRLKTENAFRVNFESLRGAKDKDYVEGFTVCPYSKEIVIYQEDHGWPAEILKKSYKSLTDVDFDVKKYG